MDKDQLGGYTMLSGDIVLFSLAVDRRNGDQRATNVQVHKLSEEQKDQNARETVSGVIFLFIFLWSVHTVPAVCSILADLIQIHSGKYLVF